MHLLSLFFKYAPFRNANDGRRFTNKPSLDAFHLHAQNRVDVDALVNEIPTKLKSARICSERTKRQLPSVVLIHGSFSTAISGWNHGKERRGGI
jgi:hypothetical protein